MLQDDQIVKELGIEYLSAEQQQDLINEYRIAIGEVIAGDLSQDQLDEFDQIIQGNQEVIDRWLAKNKPGFESDSLYALFQEGYDEDPEKVPADKAFAATAWIEKNSPDFAEKVAAVRDRFKFDIAQYK